MEIYFETSKSPVVADKLWSVLSNCLYASNEVLKQGILIVCLLIFVDIHHISYATVGRC